MIIGFPQCALLAVGRRWKEASERENWHEGKGIPRRVRKEKGDNTKALGITQ